MILSTNIFVLIRGYTSPRQHWAPNESQASHDVVVHLPMVQGTARAPLAGFCRMGTWVRHPAPASLPPLPRNLLSAGVAVAVIQQSLVQRTMVRFAAAHKSGSLL